MNEVELLAAQDRLLTAARDLIRAQRQNIGSRTFLKSLENAVAVFADSEFDDWCQDVDQIVQAVQRNGNINHERRQSWDYSKYFAQDLTTVQAANLLQYHLISG